MTSDGKAYGPKRFKEIVNECYFISSSLNTSYTDILDISFQERVYLIDFINKTNEANNEALNKIQAEAKQRK